MSTIDDILEHHGVKGMRWGVRRESGSSGLKTLGPDKIVLKTKGGDTLTLLKASPTPIHKILAKVSPNYKKAYAEGAFLNIHDKAGKKVGDAQVWKKSDDELYLNWITIKSSARGQGYATAALKAAEKFGSQQGFKKMTLEVPGDAPDARHIYEKLGFKVTKEISAQGDDVWGGLTEMEYKFKNAKHSNLSHSGSLLDEYGWFLEGVKEYMDTIDLNPIDEVLAHHGIKGMRWGVRRSGLNTGKIFVEKDDGTKRTTRVGFVTNRKPARKAPTSEDFKRAQSAKSKVVKGKTHALSNDELQALVKRMNLEKQCQDLNTKQGSDNKAKAVAKVGGKFAGEVIANVGKQQASRLLNEAVTNAAKKAAKK